ncbi:hypothetical protein N7492_009508 [Penicillium capsulatum]|uniref:Tail specific protease domain-containing protein n=1 Tax=Penicillium capsulatum TaxID=69766 RepID=A0A9W9HV14_9EURO|nr:hypothetical protein N7492_009508 [Penicillium capsulatum]KAJ6106898.1 hypothetical protein N7512_010415 [Penicillium capsulatum]
MEMTQVGGAREMPECVDSERIDYIRTLGFMATLLAGAAQGLEPCAEVTDSFQKSKKSNSIFLISGDLAHRCLQSIPFKVSPAVAVVDEYRKYLPSQSTIDDLKRWPETPGGVNSAREIVQLKSGPLTDIGKGDAQPLAKRKSPSAVKSINGTDATQYLEKFSSNQGQQDPDARYNTVFNSLSRTTKVPKGLWMGTTWWPGPSSLLESKNGTKKNFETLATAYYEVMEAQNGTAMYDRASKGQSEFSSQQSDMSNNRAADKPGYPKTTIRADHALVYGYTSNKDAPRDTAVLALPTFSILSSNMAPFVRGFLRNATQQGKKKLLIDLSENTGGNIVAAFSLFAELFPGKEILFASFNLTETSDNGDNLINGYGPVPLNPRKAAFAPENITLITDGFFASTCTTFVTLMKEQGVRSIAFGGRPRTEPMQAMGGVKGAQSVYLPDISAYGPDDDTTPLQFVYKAADCRRFFTVENYFHQESVWQAAAEAMFGDGECVGESTKGKGN